MVCGVKVLTDLLQIHQLRPATDVRVPSSEGDPVPRLGAGLAASLQRLPRHHRLDTGAATGQHHRTQDPAIMFLILM